VNPKDLAAWAAKFAKQGTKAAVAFEDEDVPPPRQPVPWGRPAPLVVERPRAGQVWGPPPETDMLVKPGPSRYADELARVPDLAPDLTGGADSMSGHMSPESRQALAEAGLPVEHVRPDDPRDEVPRSRFAGTGHVAPLVDLQTKPN
jgi:hypothetical protein